VYVIGDVNITLEVVGFRKQKLTALAGVGIGLIAAEEGVG